jgi:hypothetical protein
VTVTVAELARSVLGGGALVVELQLEAAAGVSTPPHQRGKRRG